MPSMVWPGSIFVGKRRTDMRKIIALCWADMLLGAAMGMINLAAAIMGLGSFLQKAAAEIIEPQAKKALIVRIKFD